MKIYKIRYGKPNEGHVEDRTVLVKNFEEAYSKAEKELAKLLKTDSKHEIELLRIVFDSEVTE